MSEPLLVSALYDLTAEFWPSRGWLYDYHWAIKRPSGEVVFRFHRRDDAERVFHRLLTAERERRIAERRGSTGR